MSTPRRHLCWLDPRKPDEPFPDPSEALSEPDGLLAIGGDLSPDRLLRAYRSGIFPWYNPDEPILWWSPDPRTVLDPRRMHRSRSLRRAIRRADYAITADERFDEVIRGCAQPRPGQHGTWLGPDLIQAFCRLHALGHVHSLEVWRHGELIGGVYGVAVGRAFFGESMFSRRSNASKIALHYLCLQLARWDFELLDCQVRSEHLCSLGAQEIPREQFLQTLARCATGLTPVEHWRLDIEVPRDPEHLPSDWPGSDTDLV